MNCVNPYFFREEEQDKNLQRKPSVQLLSSMTKEMESKGNGGHIYEHVERAGKLPAPEPAGDPVEEDVSALLRGQHASVEDDRFAAQQHSAVKLIATNSR